MCGIFGIYGVESGRGLEECARELTHRGPDGFGSHFDARNKLYFAHCRLSIIDLSEKGSQPMSNEDGTIWLTYNGEIYNFQELKAELTRLGHTFKSQTDSEVIIHAYEEFGTECVGDFNGMFSFAIWDGVRQRLFVARDRLGIKPLYYAHLGGYFVFASEPKAIIKLSFFRKEIYYPALFSFLIYRYVAGEFSIWKGIKRLLPAHILVLDVPSERIDVRRYWRPEVREKKWNMDDALETLDDIFSASVRDCLISDVPVGVFLSGGIDSTCVTSAATREFPAVNTFSIGFEGWDRNELETARASASFFGSTHHEATVSIENFEDLETVFDYYDEPLGDNSMFPTFLVSKQARRFATVALSGDGGDELFAGYEWYTQTEHCRPVKKVAFRLAPFFKALGLANTEAGRRCSVLEHYRRMTVPAFLVSELKTLFPYVSADLFPAEETYLFRQYYRPELSGYKRLQYIDLFTFLVDNNLAKVDRASMAHSLEVRVPFLDHRLVEFAFSLPDDLCVRDSRKKYLLRVFLERNGGSHVLNQPKQGFSCPVEKFWPIDKMLGEVLDGSLVKNGIIDHGVVKSISEGHDGNRNFKIWLLAVLERWSSRWLLQ